jgi:hypothetical protein
MDFRLEVVVLPDWPAWYARYMADEAAGEGAGK